MLINLFYWCTVDAGAPGAWLWRWCRGTRAGWRTPSYRRPWRSSSGMRFALQNRRVDRIRNYLSGSCSWSMTNRVFKRLILNRNTAGKTSISTLPPLSKVRQTTWYRCSGVFKPALWNRNRRKLNFLTSRIGTGTVTCQKVGTGTVINYGSGTRHIIMYLISFI
jgi:hypothetical protein